MRPSFGQYPPASHVILHLSDTHLLAADARLGGTIDVTANFERTLDRIRRLDPRPDAIVFTGDLTDLGEPDAYRRLRELVEPVAAELHAPIIWVAGNHDERGPMRTSLLGEPASDAPIIGVWDLAGLRIIALDTSVPGWHHGELGADQLAWLTEVLSTPAPHGTILALHHPPLPSSLPLFDILELRDQPALADVIADTDVRAVLAGHLHAAMSGTFAGVPVSVAAATCYTMDLGLTPQSANGMDAGQSFNLVHVYEHTITHSVVPVDYVDGASTFTPEWYAMMAELTPQERLDRFSRKPGSGTDAG